MIRFVALLLLATMWIGCRIEDRPADAAIRDATVADTLLAVGPPVLAGDTTHVDTAEAAIAEPPAPPVVAPSGLVIPVEGIQPADLANTFDDARGQGREHDAIDIIAPHGTPVLAATDGRILRLFESERGGLTIYQLGPDSRTVYYYAHLNGYADGLAAEQPVRRGQVIGFVGDTGNAVPGNHHLHFAIWTVDDPAQFWDGTPINPYPLLAGP
ncbi:MAG: M23 family metallopeptidase [Rhodothermaceae bacterium]|nr:M23 family metallopeptidase [Rhodothermaceae bacterium]